MDAEKSREFYMERYYRAIEQFGANSLTAKICKKKLALLGAGTKRHSTSEVSSATEEHSEEDTKA